MNRALCHKAEKITTSTNFSNDTKLQEYASIINYQDTTEYEGRHFFGSICSTILQSPSHFFTCSNFT